jgi:2-methylisocitrate lyase-like PEP mutase family enzyme
MSKQAAVFRSLHDGRELLRLANAWDAGSARVVESLGAKAVATTSAGMAWAAGYADGNNMPTEVVSSITANIVRVIKVPLTVDIEGGYSSNAKAVGELAKRLAAAGAVGINLEDGSDSPDLLARKIESVKSSVAKNGHEMFVNARTDVYLASLVDAARAVEEVLGRAKVYSQAGADGLFVPGLTSLREIRQISEGTELPLNVMAWDGLPAPNRLQAAGVRRLSAGSAISQRIWAQTKTLAHQFLSEGKLSQKPMSFAHLQDLFE